VLIVLPDDVSTGDFAPDGAIVMAFRSNVAAIATFTLRRFDPHFANRAREWGGGFLVAGHNYGQGFSREHAALAPKYLGVKAVIAKSFARIHRRNLIAQGIPPLTFQEESDYTRACQGDSWEIPEIRRALESGAEELILRCGERSCEFPVMARFTPHEREVLLAGGLLAQLRQGGRPMSVHGGRSDLVDQGSPVTNPVPDETIR
jgi:aconitate hydratase